MPAEQNAAIRRLSVFGENAEQKRERRGAQHRIARLLTSDLFKRDFMADHQAEAVWVSPLNWRVRFRVEAERWLCVIEHPDGREYAVLENPDAHDVDAVLP